MSKAGPPMTACGARKLRWAAEVECEVADERPGVAELLDVAPDGCAVTRDDQLELRSEADEIPIRIDVSAERGPRRLTNGPVDGAGQAGRDGRPAWMADAA